MEMPVCMGTIGWNISFQPEIITKRMVDECSSSVTDSSAWV